MHGCWELLATLATDSAHERDALRRFRSSLCEERRVSIGDATRSRKRERTFGSAIRASLYSRGTTSSTSTHRSSDLGSLAPILPFGSSPSRGLAFQCRRAKLLSFNSSRAQPPPTNTSAHASIKSFSITTLPVSAGLVS